ncbi:MAG: DUF364 domain-containing protein [Deltaproteobacteria bacterium]|nr:DUF364 domain-containing protein [Deltaproteobacteria bacterium]
MLKTPTEKWALYDQLLALTDPGQPVTGFESGRFWLMVTTASGAVGLAQKPGGDPPQSPVGLSLRETAQFVKSWDFNQAAVGLAAINAAINSRPLAKPGLDAFDFYLNEVKGRKVAVVGHFPYLNRYKSSCQLTILERNPQPGDLPDSAAEYILPEQDYVFVTGSALINKTLPRLLELSAQAVVTLVGPSVPLTPLLFDYGVATLAGLIVDDTPQLIQGVKTDQCEAIFKSGSRKVNLQRPQA